SIYQMWREPLRYLSVLSDLSDQEAAILKPLISDIGDLFGRDIPDAPHLEPQDTQKRLFALIIEMFRRLRQPVVIILEDLQWAGSESLALLNHVSKAVSGLPLFLIGSYRDDEDLDLARRLPGMTALKLSRLSETSIRELSGSI